MNIDARRLLRKQLRAARRAIPCDFRARASRLVAMHVDRAFPLRAGQRVALYSALPDELHAAPLIALAESRGCTVVLPRIDRRTKTIHFIERAGARTDLNHLGIEEPAGTREHGARWLDVVFLPLVGFDGRGMRLGMGGGYYDRTFAFRNLRRAWRGPRLVGIAYSMQRVEHIEPESHDVKLDAVVTEEGIAYKHIS